MHLLNCLLSMRVFFSPIICPPQLWTQQWSHSWKFCTSHSGKISKINLLYVHQHYYEETGDNRCFFWKLYINANQTGSAYVLGTVYGWKSYSANEAEQAVFREHTAQGRRQILTFQIPQMQRFLYSSLREGND